MTQRFTLDELEAFDRGFDAADELIHQFNNEGRAWTLRIPAQMDDPDLVFANAIAAGRRLLAALR